MLKDDKKQKYICFDFETCNLNLLSPDNKPWQLSYIITEGYKTVKEKDCHIKWPDLKRSEEARKITRFDDEKYKRGPYKRHRSSYDKGGRRKHFKNQATGEYGNTKRSVWKGKTGFGGLDSLARGITESKTYNNIEEEKLFNTSNDIDSLLESLNKMEKKQNEDETQ